MGNLSSLRNAFNYLGASVNIISKAEQIENCNTYLPGVGSFKSYENYKKKHR